MEEIEVGEYVRTNKGEIAKVVGIDDDKWLETTSHIGYVEPPEDIKKHSKNIIDLIEVGDYVNGKEVHKYNGNLGIIAINQLGWTFIAFKDGTYPIETIVTKEAFANAEYRVEIN